LTIACIAKILCNHATSTLVVKWKSKILCKKNGWRAWKMLYYSLPVSTEKTSAKYRMVECGGCHSRVFIPGDLEPFATVPCKKCNHPVMLPVRLHQYELRGIIASGGMGTVYRAMDLMLEREVAVKMMRKELANDPHTVECFIREARACGSLTHTNIIHIYAFDRYNEQLYMVMELADRGSLDQRIDREGHLPELKVLDIGIKIASALDTALKHGLLHRDIKPGNILFNADDEPKLVDFGLAGSSEMYMAASDTIWGTVRYVAPEKIKREGETFQSDMYSLGATLYHALTGHPPFEGETNESILLAHVHTPVTPPHHLLFEVTKPTSDALVRAMAKRPEDRFSSYDEMIMELTAARSKLLVSQYHVHQPE
jgi:serine/threonine protein kinase